MRAQAASHPIYGFVGRKNRKAAAKKDGDGL